MQGRSTNIHDLEMASSASFTDKELFSFGPCVS